MTSIVQPDSLVTLHYSIALQDGTELISTFSSAPATLQLGSGELAPTLERCLAGVPLGQRHVFLLEPEQAFGPHDPQMVGQIPLADLPAGSVVEELSMVEFGAPDGSRYSGLVRELSADSAIVDFNHPLAGKAIRFEVEIIGVL